MPARTLRRPPRLTDMFSDSRLKEVTALLGDDNEALQSLKSLLAEERAHIAGATGDSFGSPVSYRSQHDSTTQTDVDRHTASSPDRSHISDQKTRFAGATGDSLESPVAYRSQHDSTTQTDTDRHTASSPDRSHISDQKTRFAGATGDSLGSPVSYRSHHDSTKQTDVDRHTASSSVQSDESRPSKAQAQATQPTPDARSSLPPFVLPDSMSTLPMSDEELLLPGQIPQYQPFPVEYLPAPIQRFVTQQSQSRNCDLATIALPILSVLASALGGNQRIQLKRDSSEPAILWTAVVREGMASLDPILEAAIAPLRHRQALAFQQQQTVMLKYRHKLAAHRYNQRRYPDGSYPPVEPLAERTLTVDWTLPNLTRLLTKQSRGLLICPLELDGWLSKSTGNGVRAVVDRQAWFDLHAGRSVMIEGRTPVHLSSAAVSLTGTLSAEVLSHRLTKSHIACGLTGRLLFASPPVSPFCWKDEEVDQATLDGYAAVLERLFSLSGPEEVVSGANSTCVTLSAEARDSFDMFVTELGTQQWQIDDALSAWVSNLPSQAARLALVLHQTRWAAGEAVDRNICDHHSMQSGIALARWFTYEAQRTLKRFSLTAERRDLQQLFEWIQRQNKPVGPRDICRYNSRKYPTAELALKAFNQLEQAGVTNWFQVPSGPRGGRPTWKMKVKERYEREDESYERKGTSDEEEAGEEEWCHNEVSHDEAREPSQQEELCQQESEPDVTGDVEGWHAPDALGRAWSESDLLPTAQSCREVVSDKPRQ